MQERKLLIDLMHRALRQQDFNNFISYEMMHYTNYIKQIETKEHYEACLRDVELMTETYGSYLKRDALAYPGVPSTTICYFLPSIDNDLAHIQILAQILEKHNPSICQIVVAGYSSRTDGCGSNILTALEKSGKIDIIPLKQTHESLVGFISWLNLSRAAQLIIMSAPTLIPAFVAALGANRVTWFSSKFELECFPSLLNRVSCCGDDYQVRQVGETIWHRMPAALNISVYQDAKPTRISRSSCKLVSINREEKIRAKVFLESVSKILEYNHGASFFWTGRREDSVIKAYFLERGLGDRSHYIGWVNPEEALLDFDVFLDTPSLSGTVAAMAFAAGIPMVTFRNSQSWIEFFESKLKEVIGDNTTSRFSFPLIANEFNEYVDMATSLINDLSFYNQTSHYQRLAGRTCLFNTTALYEAHQKYIQRVTSPAPIQQ